MASLIPRSTLAGAIGNTVEWFDFAVYGYFAKEIGEAFFPADVPSLQLLSAFAVFAVGYLMRPVGGLLLGPIGDLVGRRALLLVSVAVMAACSLGIALLPPTSAWGNGSAVLLVLLRLLQGLSVGGEFTGSVVALVEAAPSQRRGLTASFAGAGAVLGFVGGSLAAALIHLWLAPAAVQQWGWRVPFVLGAALGIWALGLRTHLGETRPDQAPSSLAAHLAELRGQWPAMLRLMGAVALSAVSFYAATVFAVQEVSARLPALAARFNAITTLNQAIGVGLILLGGHLADRGAPPQPGAGRGCAAGDAADRRRHPAGLWGGPVDRARAADAVSGRLPLALARSVPGGPALQCLFLLLQPGGGAAWRHSAAGRHLAGGKPGADARAGALFPDLGAPHAAGLPPAGAISAARLAGLRLQGATRTSEPESAVGWLPGAAVIVYTKRLPSGLTKLVAFWPSG